MIIALSMYSFIVCDSTGRLWGEVNIILFIIVLLYTCICNDTEDQIILGEKGRGVLRSYESV